MQRAVRNILISWTLSAAHHRWYMSKTIICALATYICLKVSMRLYRLHFVCVSAMMTSLPCLYLCHRACVSVAVVRCMCVRSYFVFFVSAVIRRFKCIFAVPRWYIDSCFISVVKMCVSLRVCVCVCVCVCVSACLSVCLCLCVSSLARLRSCACRDSVVSVYLQRQRATRPGGSIPGGSPPPAAPVLQEKLSATAAGRWAALVGYWGGGRGRRTGWGNGNWRRPGSGTGAGYGPWLRVHICLLSSTVREPSSCRPTLS